MSIDRNILSKRECVGYSGFPTKKEDGLRSMSLIDSFLPFFFDILLISLIIDEESIGLDLSTPGAKFGAHRVTNQLSYSFICV